MMMLGRCAILVLLAACTTHVHHHTHISERRCPVTTVDDGVPEAAAARDTGGFVNTPTGPVTPSGAPIAVDLDDDRPARRAPARRSTPDPDDDAPKLKPLRP